MIRHITSLQHPLVKHWTHLRKSRSYRYEQKRVMLEGIKIVTEVCQQTPALSLIATSPQQIPEGILEEQTFIVSDAILKKISGVDSPEGLLAEMPMPTEASLEEKKRILVLDGINDPGNMGTLFRTALALGWDGVYILPHSCDPFNDKALRAAKGATFQLPFLFGTWEKLKEITLKCHWQLFAADLEGIAPEKVSLPEKYALVLGHEAQGLSDEAKQLCTRVTIPMSGKIESLNVSIAGGILMYLL